MNRNSRILLFVVAFLLSGCCEPDCKDKCCGDDGCGNTCPDECIDIGSWECDTRLCICVRSRPPECEGRCCGDDGVGGECPDNCVSGTHCDERTCTCEHDVCSSSDDCIYGKCCLDNECRWPACSELECGPDPICGDECGPCTPETECNEFGQCESGVLSGIGEACIHTSGVNSQSSNCALGFNCIGEYELGDCADVGECTSPASNHPDCYQGKCGYSFCSVSCEVEQCPAGFVENTSLGSCYCYPE